MYNASALISTPAHVYSHTQLKKASPEETDNEKDKEKAGQEEGEGWDSRSQKRKLQSKHDGLSPSW